MFLIVFVGSILKIINPDSMMNDDYDIATKIYYKTFISGDIFRDSVRITHKYKGNYLFRIGAISGKFEQHNKSFNAAGAYDSATVLTEAVPLMFLKKRLVLSYSIKNVEKVLLNGEFKNFHVSGTNKKGPEIYCFSYNVPKDLPQKKDLIFEYKIKEWGPELFDVFDTAEVTLSIIRGK
jgi:hypothetical protein